MASTLRRSGYDAVVYEAKNSRPSWFPTDVPIVGREIFQSRPDHVVVIPEDQVKLIEGFATRPPRKVIFCMNHFYAGLDILNGRTYADFGVSHVLCLGQTIYDYCRDRHPDVAASMIPIGIDPGHFYPRPKRECIAFIPRKRWLEAAYIRDLFRFEYPEFRDIEWVELDGRSEPEIAEALGAASVFLVLHRLDSLPLTGMEAMASGCVIAGFTGIGGREYAREENGFWADEDDFSTCIRQLAGAVQLSRETGARREAYATACAQMAARYTPATFDEAVRTSWAEILRA